jgi:hypothetical protein
MNPRVTDNDHGTIDVSLDGKELRSWTYASDDERRTKMLFAREYVEGWCDGLDNIDKQVVALRKKADDLHKKTDHVLIALKGINDSAR